MGLVRTQAGDREEFWRGTPQGGFPKESPLEQEVGEAEVGGRKQEKVGEWGHRLSP